MARLLERRCVLFSCLVAGILLLASCGQIGFLHRNREILTVAELRRLSVGDLRSQIPVRIRGYITISDPSWNVMILQDRAGNGARLESSDFSVPANQLVEVTGFAAAGGDTPAISKPTVRWVSKEQPPQPHLVPLARLFDPESQYRQVVIEGVVRATVADRSNRIAALMRIGDRLLHIRIMDQTTIDVNALVDARVRMKGVVENSYDIFGKPTWLTLWVRLGGDVTRETSPPDPASLPIQFVSSLLHSSPAHLPVYRVRVHGQVFTDKSGSKLFIKDASGVLPLELAPTAPLSIGQDLDAVGFLVPRQNSFFLGNVLLLRFSRKGSDSAPKRELTTVAQIHSLTAEQAGYEYPVRLRAVVTFFDPKYGLLFVQDATGGTFVQARNLAARTLPAGEMVEVQGVTQAGFFAPQVDRCVVKTIGPGKLPVPTSGNSEELYIGKEDSDWVEASGVIQSVRREAGHTILSLVSGVHRFDAELLGLSPWADAMLNSQVSLRGVAGTRFNMRKQITGITIWVPGREQICVLWRAPDPSSLPFTPIAQLLQFSPSANPDSRVKVRGVVTYSTSDGPTYIQDSTGAVKIANHRPIALRPGDLITVLGFAQLAGSGPAIHDAVLTKTGSANPPLPVHVSAGEVLEGDYDSQLIQIDAVLLDRVINQTGETLMLQAGRTLFDATVEPGIRLPAFRSGAVLRVSGVCSVQLGTVRGIEIARALTLLLRSPSDITILQRESWWSLEHALELTALLAGLSLLAFVWGLILRHRVQQQTQVITEKLAQEENLKLAAEEANRTKSEFLAVMSHEIRTPLNGVLGMTSLLLGTPLNEEQLEFVNTIRHSGRALMTVISDILDFSKIEAGKLTLEHVAFDLRAVAQESMDVMALAAKEKNLALSIQFDSCLDCELQGDPTRLGQILLNLLSNAIKFTQKGSVTLQLQQVRADAESKTVRISITDTGIGISPAQQAQLFKSFSQADTSTTRKYGGTGLGLAITKRLIEHMGGTIGVESSLGAGSTFWFSVTFPIGKCNGDSKAEDLPASELLSV